MSAHLNALSPGHQLGAYKLSMVLGAGAFGITYLGVDLRRQANVAIKEYIPNDFALRRETRQGNQPCTVVPKSPKEKADFDWGLKRFLTEGKVLGRFSHPISSKCMATFVR